MQGFLFYSLDCPQASSLMVSMNLVVLFESPELFCKRGALGASAVPELHNTLGGLWACLAWAVDSVCDR